ncbi:ZIP family zinc transporter [Croceifilum oryzae]|uniref:ZIP family zinc transporter n=1 Tax=Croceifilum oryzae TaxID=1553429 RepID=A0AAJ1TKW9_9BACL|nr:ZIP family metal transporter [Croceifilum oryzae]MDQ0418382.1 ZIP family zinc transporter [Croceifilum oryzae]
MGLINEAIVYSALTGVSTFIGAILVCFLPINKRVLAFSLGLSVGVMLWITYGTLLPVSFQYGNWTEAFLGMGLAGLILVLIHQMPFGKVRGQEGNQEYAKLGIYLFAAIALHNIPEGALIGIGFGTMREMGMSISLAMVIHNIPEGMSLGAPLLAANCSKRLVGLIGLLSGAVLPLGTWLGGFVYSPRWIAIALVFAATTMVWVAWEVLLRSWKLSKRNAFIGIGCGMILMYVIHLFHFHGLHGMH